MVQVEVSVDSGEAFDRAPGTFLKRCAVKQVLLRRLKSGVSMRNRARNGVGLK